MIKGLRAVEADKLATTLEIIPPTKSIKIHITPCIDGQFLPKPIKELRKIAPKKKRLIGVCKDEGLFICKLFSLNKS